MKPARAMLALAACLAASGCGSEASQGGYEAPDPVRPMRFVHLRWPGRPLSDRMDREVFARRDIREMASRIGLDVFSVPEAPPSLRKSLPGFGTLALLAGDSAIVGLAPGARSAAQWEAFVDRAERDGPRLGELRGLEATEEIRRERARLALGLGLLEEAAAVVATGVADLDLVLRVHAARGDVAAMRSALETAPAEQRTALREAEVHLAGREPAAALESLSGVPDGERGPRFEILQARALHAQGETRSAAARLTALLDAGDLPAELEERARGLLADWWYDTADAAHSHEPEGEGR